MDSLATASTTSKLDTRIICAILIGSMENQGIEIYESVANSNLKPVTKSRVLQMLELAAPHGKSPQSLLGVLVESSIAGTTGAALGILQAELKDGLDYNRKIPIDLILAALAKAGGLVYSSSISREVGGVALGIYSYRKVSDLLLSFKPKGQVETKGTGHVDHTANEEPIAAE